MTDKSADAPLKESVARGELTALKYRAAAKRLYAAPSDDDIEIDDNNPSEDPTTDGCEGVWVKAWVWVRHEEAAKEGAVK